MVGHLAEQQRLVSAAIVAKLARYKSTGVLLDVGFGNGSLLLTAAEWGFRVMGLDMRPANVNALQEFGIAGYCCDIAQFQPDTPLDIICLADVLEHIPHPRIALAACKRLLPPSGLVLLSMPNYESPMWHLLDRGGTNPYWAELEHFHNFSRARLLCLMEEYGFRLLEFGISARYRACMEVLFCKESL